MSATQRTSSTWPTKGTPPLDAVGRDVKQEKVRGRSLLCHGNPSKCAVEAAWAVWFLVWSSIMTVIMATNLGGIWGDAELMTLGVGLGAATFLVPACFKSFVIDVVVPHVFGVVFSHPQRAYAHQHFMSDLWTMTVGVTTLSFGLNWWMTPFFYDVLHMRYGFNVTWTYDRTPLFLYWITIAYFSSYSVLGAMLYRWAAWRPVPPAASKDEGRLLLRSGRRRMGSLLPWYNPKAFFMRIAASFLLAFLETLLMANPLIDHLFCYDDYFLTITFGSACYGVSFVFAVWSWTSSVPEEIDELLATTATTAAGSSTATPKTQTHGGGGAWHSFLCSVGTTIVTTICLELIREHIAPQVTTVVNDSPAYGGCLLRGA
jgi:hypothetical protein